MWWRMFFVALLTGLFSSAPRPAAYSDWVGIYARIDKVVLEPSANAPERVQLWGAFAFAREGDRNSYEPARRGYLYYALKPGKEEVCRKEWADFKAIAGTGQVLGFGSRNLALGRLREEKAQPADPDLYPVANGLVKMSDRSADYPPIRELKSLPRKSEGTR